jgi:hypothetical protein
VDRALGEGASMSDSESSRDPLDEILSLAEAAELSGLSAHTLTQQAERGKLHARKVGHSWITTRHWLAAYLAGHARRRAKPRE